LEATLIKINQKRIATGSDFDPKTGLLFSNPRTENNIDTDDTKSDDGRNIANITSSVHHLTKESTDELLTRIRDSSRWTVTSIERKEKSYSPPLPFTTSTLQH
jgi:DNA topoisomerase IA